VNFYTDTASSEDIKNLILNHKDTVTLSGSQLTNTQQWDCVPVSQDKYHSFIQPAGGNSTVLLDPGISTVLILMETAPEDQQYEFSMAGTWYARYRFTGPLANCAIAPPTAPLAAVNKSRDFAEAMGSVGRPIMAAMGGALKDAASDALPGMLGNLMRQTRGFPPLAGRFPLALPM